MLLVSAERKFSRPCCRTPVSAKDYGVARDVAGAASSSAAVPVEPIAAILDAFRSHAVVTLGEGHGNEQGEAFRLSLIRDPRFAATVNDIVVESGNARYQALMNQFTRGDDVPDRSLRRVWQDTTQAWVWDTPNYEAFFRAVRAVNASLPRARQLRVLLGDPPIDWDGVKNRKDVNRFLEDRDGFPAELIRREVLAKNRRALVIYGFGHLLRTYPPPSNPTDAPSSSIVHLVEHASATKVFSIYPILRLSGDVTTIQSDIASWPTPSLAILGGTVLGAPSIKFYVPIFPPTFRAGDPMFESLRMEEQFDAVLYLGAPSRMTLSSLSPSLCADPEYMKMRLGRLALIGSSEGEDLKKLCATVAPK